MEVYSMTSVLLLRTGWPDHAGSSRCSGGASRRRHCARRQWGASVARCSPNRWNPLLLPGGVRPRFCPLNLKALASQLGSNRKSLVIVGTCVNGPLRWTHTDRQPGLYCIRRSCFAPISSGPRRGRRLVVEAPGYCPPGPKCLFHQILYRHSRLPGPPKIGIGGLRRKRLTFRIRGGTVTKRTAFGLTV